ncbi:MAG: DUF3667 domain-containing protein, partial [Prevotellaceae bacterium]|nr:DUF3667 domain-containing protein [Prevotellaceae bacterium]
MTLKRLTAYFRLWHIKQIQGFPAPVSANEQTHCRNCGTDFTGNYCPRCGQSRKTPRFTFRTGVQNMLAGLTNIGNGFGRTLIELLLRPGYMMADFIGGKRVHYFRPFQTLFVLAAIYILLTQLVLPIGQNEEKQKAATTTEQTMIADSIRTATSAVWEKEDTPFERTIQSMIKGAERVKQMEMPFARRVTNVLSRWAHGNKAVLILCTIPFLVLATRIVFRRRTARTMNFTEHVLVQAYIASQLLLFSILYIPFNAAIDPSDLVDIPWWLI